jgi:hypothetical protein
MNTRAVSDAPEPTAGPNLENLTEEERAAVRNVMARAQVSRQLCMETAYAILKRADPHVC